MTSAAWLMPNKMIKIAVARKTPSAPVVAKQPPPIRYLSEKEITNGLDEKTSNAFLKAQMCQKKINENREKKKIKLIEFIPTQEATRSSGGTSRADKLKCKAKTMAGKPCPFNASCGDFCKKHQQPDGFKI